MANHEYIGRIGRQPLGAIVWKLAERIRHARGPLAVCIDPEGRVTVELYEHAVPDEVVGVYDKTLGFPELDKLIQADIQDLLAERAAAMGRVA